MGSLHQLPVPPLRRAFMEVENCKRVRTQLLCWAHYRVFPRTLYRLRFGRHLSRFDVGWKVQMAVYHRLYGDPLGIREFGRRVRALLSEL